MAINRRILISAAAGISLSASARHAHAEAYPPRSVRFIIPYAAGGLPDTAARIVGQRLSTNVGHPFVIENRAGGGGAIAATALAQSPADGYTFMVTDGPMLVISRFTSAKPTFDAERDFVPVSVIGTAPLYLAVNTPLGVNTLDQLVALARSKPGTLTYGSAGLGSIHHLTAEAMKAALDLHITHVPFRGSAQSVPAMIAGQVDMTFASPPALMDFVRNGRAKLIAINSSQRAKDEPEVPALNEKIPGFDFAFNVVVLAKSGTPQESIERINREIATAASFPGVAGLLLRAGIQPIGASVSQSALALHAEMQRITAAAQRAGLKPE